MPMASSKKNPAVAAPGLDNRVPLTARVTREFKKRVRQYALDNDVDIQDVIRDALEEYLKKRTA
jgi:hypothetical protein